MYCVRDSLINLLPLYSSDILLHLPDNGYGHTLDQAAEYVAWHTEYVLCTLVTDPVIETETNGMKNVFSVFSDPYLRLEPWLRQYDCLIVGRTPKPHCLPWKKRSDLIFETVNNVPLITIDSVWPLVRKG